MASKKTLTQDNLEALGATRLAALLIEVSDGNAALKRRLRLELAGAESPAALAKEIRKRLATIGRSRAFVEWQNVRSLANDLTRSTAPSSIRWRSGCRPTGWT